MTGLPLSVTALVITLFLLPGFAFVTGLYASPTVNRDASTISAPATFGIMLVMAIGSNFAVAFIFWLNACLSRAEGGLCGPYNNAFLESLTLGAMLALAGVSLALSVGMAWLGWTVCRLVETGRLPTSMLHGWAYDYVRNPAPKTAFVLTSIGKDFERIGYEGALHSLRIASDGAIKTVTLKDVSRFRLNFEEGAEGRVRIDSPGNTEWQDTDLTIEGGNIDNIAIRVLPSLLRFEDALEGDPSPFDD